MVNIEPDHNQGHTDNSAATPVEELQRLVLSIQEPTVRRYVEESVRCFEGGAYSAAIVSAWCAAARYLRLITERIGFDLIRLYLDNESNDPAELDGQPLYSLCDKILDTRKFFQGKSNRLGTRLQEFWSKRCQCAHPTDVFPDEAEAFNLVFNHLNWLATRVATQESVRYQIVLECIDKKEFSLSSKRARELVNLVAENELEPLAHALLLKFLSTTTQAEEDLAELSRLPKVLGGNQVEA